MGKKGSAKSKTNKELRIGSWYWLKYVKEEDSDEFVEEDRSEFKIKSKKYKVPKKRFLQSNLFPPLETVVTAQEYNNGQLTDIDVTLNTNLAAALYVGSKREMSASTARITPMRELSISLDEIFKSLTQCQENKTIKLTITPPSDALCHEPAGPGMGKDREDKPGNAGSKGYYDALYRSFSILVDFVCKDGIYRMENIRSENDKSETYWHAELDPYLENKNNEQQCLMVDWKPDWLRRIWKSGATRPYMWDREDNSIATLVLHNVSGSKSGSRKYPMVGSALNGFFTESKYRKCKKDASECLKKGYEKYTPKKGKDGKEPKTIYRKLVSNHSGAHYLVDVDGHITKLAHEEWATQHGGGKGAVTWRTEKGVNNTSIGIEHCILGNGPEFYKSLVNASINLVKKIVKENNIPPWNVIGHNCVYHGKPGCPAKAFPWNKYESVDIDIEGKKSKLVLGADAKASVNDDTIYDDFFSDNKSKLLNAKADKSVMKELQSDLTDIGFMFHSNNGKYDDGTKLSVQRFIFRFMNVHHKAGDTASHNKGVNLNTARRIKQVLIQKEKLIP